MKRHLFQTLRGQAIIMLSVSAFIIMVGSGIYFFLYSQAMQQHARERSDAAAQSVMEDLGQLFQDIRTSAVCVAENRYAQLFLMSNKASERIEYNNILLNSVFQLANYNTAVSNLSLVGMDGNIQGFPKKHYAIVDSLIQEDNILNPEQAFRVSRICYDNYTSSYYLTHCEPVYGVVSGQISQKVGVCIAVADLSRISATLQDVQITPNSFFLVVDDSGNIITNTASPNAYPEMSALQQLSTSKSTAEQTLQQLCPHSLIQYNMTLDNDWGMQVISVIPIKEINRDLYFFLLASLLLFALVMLCLLIWFFSLLRNIADPITQITQFMQRYSISNSAARLDIHKNNEIGTLALQCNEMLDKLVASTRDVLKMQSNMYELQLSLKQAELSALQSQINPHFLYNTLDCIRGYGYLLNSSEVVEIASSLSSLMRYAIKGPQRVPVRDELNCVNCYLSIIRIRFGERFTFHVQADEDVLEYKMPRFLLQPLVENAIYHGLEPQARPGELWVHVCANQEERRLGFLVRDNGAGFSPEKLDAFLKAAQSHASTRPSSAGIGLLNISDRIHLLYGDRGVFTIDSKENCYTQVVMEIPLD